MKENMIRIISIILLATICVVALSVININYATVDGEMSFGDVSPNNTIKDNAKDTTGTAKAAQRILQAVLTITQVIGVGVAVIMLIVLAIKYISAAPSDKAEIKKHMVVYVVGAVVLFAASGILEIIKRFALMVDV
jgi:hypothetical protein